MTIQIGDRIPEVVLKRIGQGVENVTKNRKTGRYRQTNWSPLLCTARPDAD